MIQEFDVNIKKYVEAQKYEKKDVFHDLAGHILKYLVYYDRFSQLNSGQCFDFKTITCNIMINK